MRIIINNKVIIIKCKVCKVYEGMKVTTENMVKKYATSF